MWKHARVEAANCNKLVRGHLFVMHNTYNLRQCQWILKTLRKRKCSSAVGYHLVKTFNDLNINNLYAFVHHRAFPSDIFIRLLQMPINNAFLSLGNIFVWWWEFDVVAIRPFLQCLFNSHCRLSLCDDAWTYSLLPKLWKCLSHFLCISTNPRYYKSCVWDELTKKKCCFFTCCYLPS